MKKQDANETVQTKKRGPRKARTYRLENPDGGSACFEAPGEIQAIAIVRRNLANGDESVGKYTLVKVLATFDVDVRQQRIVSTNAG